MKLAKRYDIEQLITFPTIGDQFYVTKDRKARLLENMPEEYDCCVGREHRYEHGDFFVVDIAFGILIARGDDEADAIEKAKKVINEHKDRWNEVIGAHLESIHKYHKTHKFPFNYFE